MQVCVCRLIAFIYWLVDKNNNPEGKGDKSNHNTQGKAITHTLRIHTRPPFPLFYSTFTERDMTTVESLETGLFKRVSVQWTITIVQLGLAAAPVLFLRKMHQDK